MNQKRRFIENFSGSLLVALAAVALLWFVADCVGASIPHQPAPHVEPVEPVTRTLSQEEADALLESDWLFQANDLPTMRRIQDEILWARELAGRFAKGGKVSGLDGDMAELGRLSSKVGLVEGNDSAARELYLAIRRVKRSIMLKNPVVDFDKVVFIDNPYPQGSEWKHQARHRDGMMAVPGGKTAGAGWFASGR